MFKPTTDSQKRVQTNRQTRPLQMVDGNLPPLENNVKVAAEVQFCNKVTLL